jgi:hypothetical protein
MAQQAKPNEDPKKKRVIEFDMFVRDLEPSEEEKVRGGGSSPKNPSENEDLAK